MKTFCYVSATTRVDNSDSHITLSVGDIREVEADYYRVVEGALIFRTEKRGSEQFNPAVRVVAPGYWAEVYEKPPSSREKIDAIRREHAAREIDIEPVFATQGWR